MTKLIQIEDLHYRPDDLPPEQPDILRGIDLTIEAGAFVALLGENGSGKTTLIKHLNGLLLPTAGRLWVDNLDPREDRHHRALRSIVGMVFQNPADQIVASTVAEDIAFGLENANLPTGEIQTRVAAQLAAIDMTADADRPPHLLSGGQIQRVALAGVLARRPKVILLDEPTSMLDPLARESFLARVRELHRQGMTIVYITHHMEEALLADQVVVLQQGKVVMNGAPTEIFSQEDRLRAAGLRIPEAAALARDLSRLGWDLPSGILKSEDLLAALPACPNPQAQNRPSTDTPLDGLADGALIQLEAVHYTYLAGSPLAKPALRGVTLGVSARQVHALAGANGSGKSTLLQHINGILRPEQGTVRVGSLHLEVPDTALRTVVKQVGLVFQSPETQFFEVYVGDEIAYGPRQFGVADLRERVRAAMTLVGLDFEAYKDRRLTTLSGGEKRKVALASTLALDQDILLLDEPTAGMDPGARDELLTLFLELQAAGKTLLIASHRLDELALVAGDFSFIQAGQIQHSGPRQDLLTNREALSAAGLTAPLAVQASQALIEKGWPLEGLDTTTPNRLSAALREVQP